MNALSSEEGRVPAGSISLWVRRSGNGRPVVTLSGLGYSGWCWTELMDSLGSRIRVVAPDNRGTGRSDKPTGPNSIALMADDVVGALNALHIQDADFVAHSMGGYIAQSIAIRYPSRVRSLVLVATTRGGPGTLPVPPTTLAAWLGYSNLSPPLYAEKTMPLSFATGWTEHHPQLFHEFLSRRLEYPTPSACWLAQYKACEVHIATGLDVSRIQCPALIIHGTDDRIVPYPNGQKLAAALRYSRLVTLQSAGHLCFLEDPIGFANILAEHLNQTERNAS